DGSGRTTGTATRDSNGTTTFRDSSGRHRHSYATTALSPSKPNPVAGGDTGTSGAGKPLAAFPGATAGYNQVGEHGDDDDDAEGTVSDQAGGGHADSGGLVRDHSVLPGGGVRDRAGGAGLWAHRGATPGANGPSAGDELR